MEDLGMWRLEGMFGIETWWTIGPVNGQHLVAGLAQKKCGQESLYIIKL